MTVIRGRYVGDEVAVQLVVVGAAQGAAVRRVMARCECAAASYVMVSHVYRQMPVNAHTRPHAQSHSGCLEIRELVTLLTSS